MPSSSLASARSTSARRTAGWQRGPHLTLLGRDLAGVGEALVEGRFVALTAAEQLASWRRRSNARLRAGRATASTVSMAARLPCRSPLEAARVPCAGVGGAVVDGAQPLSGHPSCTPASSRSRRGRAAPAPPGCLRLAPACGWRSCAEEMGLARSAETDVGRPPGDHQPGPWRLSRPPRWLRKTASASPRRAHRSAPSPAGRRDRTTTPATAGPGGRAARCAPCGPCRRPAAGRRRRRRRRGQPDELGDPEAGAVEHLEDRPVATVDGRSPATPSSRRATSSSESLRQARTARGSTSAPGSCPTTPSMARYRWSDRAATTPGPGGRRQVPSPSRPTYRTRSASSTVPTSRCSSSSQAEYRDRSRR